VTDDSLFEISATSPRDEVAEKARAAYRAALEAGEIQLPEGATIDQVMAMSSPPWHTATENPFVRTWIETDETSDEGRVDPGPFLADVTGSKRTLQYKAHSYPTKVPPEIIVQLLLHYTKPGDVILDGFAGSGMTGVAAQLCATPSPSITHELRAQGSRPHWGTRCAVLNDLAPNATFHASGVTIPVDVKAFEQASAALLDRLDRELGWMYRTTASDGTEAVIDYTVWSEVFTCPYCGGAVVFYDEAFVPTTGDVRTDFPCPSCGAQVQKGRGRGPSDLRRRLTPVRMLTGDVIERVELRPVRVHFSYRKGKVAHRGSKPLDDNDHAVLARVANLSVPFIPNTPLPIDDMVHGSRLAPKGFTAVDHLYSDRSLAALSHLWHWALQEPDHNLQRALKFWIEQAFWGLSWMNRYKATDHSQVNRNQSGVYYVSSLISECSPRYNLEGSQPNRGKQASLIKTWKSIPETTDIRVTTGDASNLPLDDSSIDYIFVDPPFGANIPYADLAYMIEGWHGVLTDVEREAIIDNARHKGNAEYGTLMADAFNEFARVLKPGRWMTVEFSNSSNEVWASLQSALNGAGFVVADTRVLDKKDPSYRGATAVNAVKQDLMISCYKPDARTTSAVLSSGGAASSVWEFVGEHLKHLPAFERSGIAVRERRADRLYHRAVAYYVSLGVEVPMTAAEFYAGLDEHFNERDGLYFRPEQVEDYERQRLEVSAPEDVLFVTDERSAVAWLRRHLKDKPQTRSEILPAFLKELQVSGDRPDQMPDLLEMLEENFVQDAAGAWLVPDPAKLEHLQQLRERALLRTFESYLSSTGPLRRFRGEALQAGLKDRWKKKDYVTIAALGKRLPTDYLVENTAIMHYVRNAMARAAR
jgi:DNA modification methylase/predicted RNA-binding Zn-ribbon protein involved in translation (DUF1610 family)